MHVGPVCSAGQISCCPILQSVSFLQGTTMLLVKWTLFWVRGEISCLFTHTRASLILFLSYELGKRLRSVHWPTDSAALPPALCLPDMIVPASRCWRAERQRLPVIFHGLHHCGIFSLSVHLIISTLIQSGHYAAFKSNKGEFRRTWQWMVFSGLRYILKGNGSPTMSQKGLLPK